MPTVHPVKIELAKRGQTQRDLAGKVRVTPGVLSHVLNGHVAAWPSLRARIAGALGLSETELFPDLEPSARAGQ
jgi:transcriptional regulator with XRE-family HTH domain